MKVKEIISHPAIVLSKVEYFFIFLNDDCSCSFFERNLSTGKSLLLSSISSHKDISSKEEKRALLLSCLYLFRNSMKNSKCLDTVQEINRQWRLFITNSLLALMGIFFRKKNRVKMGEAWLSLWNLTKVITLSPKASIK